ncbi:MULTISPECIES: hypothetical protein [Staphylococcus intermedius group]|uniref:Uncharacterized protein n=1 Tax=Staphylococcus intermedius NCTC 11048 TaxID=1141106 RepID=A0A380G5D6_STAIN|nr:MULTISPECIES: hypothetical protein [Staphylococcus intermedius group]MTV20891.1 hypothetical protein [Staphylococcus delphini]PCF77713.1 hypothetical protein B4W69_13890 [Staphylococcus delphini]PCF86376.1 hypothetical protein B4W75_10500 [Staphylococcus intermedius]PNZ49336.1 hypothetical protein CD138_12935 [Staphylococcus intermedius NCTC 11048]SUM46359.1 Uncharacterised protein [Staphylococcus intermedius NCTC 11048]
MKFIIYSKESRVNGSDSTAPPLDDVYISVLDCHHNNGRPFQKREWCIDINNLQELVELSESGDIILTGIDEESGLPMLETPY